MLAAVSPILRNAIVLFTFVSHSTYAVTPSPGCLNPPSQGELGYGLNPGEYTNFNRIIPGTQRRTHRLHLPNNYNDATDTPPPFMMYFHGWTGDHTSCGDTCSVTALEKGFVVVTMSGYGKQNWGSWKHGGSSDSSRPLGPVCTPETEGLCRHYRNSGCDCSEADNCWWTTCYDSVEQVLSVLNEVQETVCFDMEQVWAVGCSNGGMFTFELARDERSAGRLKGIVPIVGLPHFGYSDGPFVEGIKMIGMWGSTDNVVPPISNTDDLDKTVDTSGYYYTSVEKVMKDWTAGNGCEGDGKDPINGDEDWGLGDFTEGMSCTQGCTEKGIGNRIVGCIFDGGHWCSANYIWGPVFNFMLNVEDPPPISTPAFFSPVVAPVSSPASSPVIETENPTPFPTVAPSASPTATPCEENENDEFLFKLKNGSPDIKTCGWLKSRNNANNICRNKVTHTIDYSPAQDVCKETCNSCNCYENRKTKFVRSIRNNGRIKLKNCDWLSKRSSRTKEDICNQTLEGGGYKTPAEACPVTCETTVCQNNVSAFWQ